MIVYKNDTICNSMNKHCDAMTYVGLSMRKWVKWIEINIFTEMTIESACIHIIHGNVSEIGMTNMIFVYAYISWGKKIFRRKHNLYVSSHRGSK